jgi:hypothetical protein
MLESKNYATRLVYSSLAHKFWGMDARFSSRAWEVGNAMQIHDCSLKIGIASLLSIVAGESMDFKDFLDFPALAGREIWYPSPQS